jgi:hypothetical protein
VEARLLHPRRLVLRQGLPVGWGAQAPRALYISRSKTFIYFYGG